MASSFFLFFASFFTFPHMAQSVKHPLAVLDFRTELSTGLDACTFLGAEYSGSTFASSERNTLTLHNFPQKPMYLDVDC